MAYPDNKETFDLRVSPEWIRQGHLNQVGDLLEALQDIFGTFPNYSPPVVGNLGNMFLTLNQLLLIEVRAASAAGLLLRDVNANMGVFIEHGGNVGIKNGNPAVDLDVTGEINSTYGFYHDRGDPAAYDKVIGDFTTDGNWNDLNLSAIVPVGAKTISINLQIVDNAVGTYIYFREKGNANPHNRAIIQTQVSNVGISADLLVSCDTDRVIEYKTSNVAITGIWLIVKGWWK